VTFKTVSTVPDRFHPFGGPSSFVSLFCITSFCY